MAKAHVTKNKRRKKVHGFLGRQKTSDGRNTIVRRRRKGRASLTV